VYRELRLRVTDLAREHADALDAPVPAAPAWRGRDVLAHFAGVCEDIECGNLEGVATDGWTAAQVDKRRDWGTDQLLDDWATRGRAIDALMDANPPGRFGQLLFDAWTHEHDLRGAVGSPGTRDSAAGACAYAWVTPLLDGRDRDLGRAALALVDEHGSTVIGDGPADASVRASRFELLRSLTGRRSLTQIRGFDWSGPPDPDRLVLIPVFTPRSEDLVE